MVGVCSVEADWV